jgi:hypothetical protein
VSKEATQRVSWRTEHAGLAPPGWRSVRGRQAYYHPDAVSEELADRTRVEDTRRGLTGERQKLARRPWRDGGGEERTEGEETRGRETSHGFGFVRTQERASASGSATARIATRVQRKRPRNYFARYLINLARSIDGSSSSSERRAAVAPAAGGCDSVDDRTASNHLPTSSTLFRRHSSSGTVTPARLPSDLIFDRGTERNFDICSRLSPYQAHTTRVSCRRKSSRHA